MTEEKFLKEWSDEHQSYMYTIIFDGVHLEFHEKYLDVIKTEENGTCTIILKNLPDNFIKQIQEAKKAL